MDTLTSMKVFAAVVETGSFAAAAERMDLSRAMASKYLAHLEQHLGTRLLQRSTRKQTLTESGAAYYERCTLVLDALHEAEEVAASQTGTPTGQLRITAPVSFGVLHMGTILSSYLERHPGICIDVVLTDRRVDLIEEGIDLAVRIGELTESGLVARKLAASRMLVTAAPAYLARCGTPLAPADLEAHNCLIYSYASPADEWVLTGPDGGRHSVKVRGNLKATNGDLIKAAVLGGSGLMRQPLFLCAQELRDGRLVHVLGDHRCDDVAIQAVYPSRKYLSAKVRSFIDHLADSLAGQEDW